MAEEGGTLPRLGVPADEDRRPEVVPRSDARGHVTSPFEPTASPGNVRKRQKVLFIMGMTRSGSTVLDNVLGEVDGFFSAGEVRLIWKRGILESRSCGCGSPVLECPVWREVVAAA
jgi:hypothetical protein